MPILNCCAYDGHNEYLKERATVAMKFVMDGCDEAQKYVREMVPLKQAQQTQQAQAQAENSASSHMPSVERQVGKPKIQPAVGTSSQSDRVERDDAEYVNEIAGLNKVQIADELEKIHQKVDLNRRILEGELQADDMTTLEEVEHYASQMSLGPEQAYQKMQAHNDDLKRVLASPQ